MTLPSDSLQTDALRSYWHVTGDLVVPDDPLPAAADVVVVGGGLLGCWTAYWLARAGVGVTLLERTAIGWGATGRNGGFVGSGAAVTFSDAIATFGNETARGLWRLTREGQALVGQVTAEEGIACDYRSPGTLSLAIGAAALDAVRRNVETQRADGIAGECLDRRAAQELIDTPLADDITGGHFTANDGQLHSIRYLTGIAAAARRHGARFCQAGVTSLDDDGDGTLVQTTAGTIRAGRVVVAVNAWSDELIPALAGLVVPVRGQILAYEPSPPVFRTGLAASTTTTGEYWQQTPDGTIVIGGGRTAAPGGDVGIRELIPTPDVTNAIEAVLPRLFPRLTGLRVARRWAGPMAFTSDFLPVADAVPGQPGVWVTGGFSGHGMPYGPRVGQLLAEAATTGRTPAELEPLRIDRPTLAPLVISS